MTLLEAALLGIVQGLTEFLPISSSGHLVIGRQLLGTGLSESMAFDVALHCGTMAAVMVYFRGDIARLLRAAGGRPVHEGDRGELAMLALATVPIAAAGLLLSGPLAAVFDSPAAAGAGLLVTAAVLGSTRFLPSPAAGDGRLGPRQALLVGLAQAVAIMPGISRSGAAIVAGLWVGMGRERAARFAFLLALPAIVGATLLELSALSALASTLALPVTTGVVLAAASGLAAIAVMMRAVRSGRLLPFALYCLVLGVATLVVGVG